ncbi:DUF4974 domain-containing protein [Spirosoma taeanense]|uniref:DUF4974 domain-containing protein n=1 Tax=Spirosoma taeanense TaxID=2735870 RepID=A0A6M5YBR9_9BACT|nr:FecR family protein [Spirosoma taeanense]QJW90342.1 DUF4974 domain-containing protein [Spirosoma taeanense]
MNYYQFTAEDLAADDYFKEWVCSPTAGTEAFWRTFLSEFPERYYQVEEARLLVMGLQKIQQRPVLAGREDALWGRIEDSLEEARPLPVVRWLTGRQVWKVAATVILVLGASWFSLQQLGIIQFPAGGLGQTEGKWIEVVNDASQVMHVQLADGSRVELQKKGRLRYREELIGAQREVYLTGDAFFNVRKNPGKPFVVYANGLVTKVLGTSFRINAPVEASTVTVDVRTGRVSVYPNQENSTSDPESKGMVLTPNQKAVFERDKGTLTKTLTDIPSLLIPNQRFEFDDARAPRVFSTIGRAYGVEMIFDEELMQHCSVTMNINEEDFFQKLDVICKVLGAHYKLIDAQVVIYSKGCPK